MMYLKMFFNKRVNKYGLIIFILLLTLMLTFNFNKIINQTLYLKMNQEVNRTATIEFNQSAEIKKIILNSTDLIESYEDKNDSYQIIFKSLNDMNNFLRVYNEDIAKTFINGVLVDETANMINNIISVLIVICIIVLFVLIILFSLSLIYTIEKDIALLKLIGFSNQKVIKIIFSFLFLYYFVLFLTAMIFTYFVSVLLNITSFQFFGFSFQYLLTIKDVFNIYIVLIGSVIISSIRMLFLIKKISPINLIKY